MLLHFAYADHEEQHMRFEKVKEIYQKFLDIEDVDPTLCYIQYMKFSRRVDGTTAARGVFKKAREDKRSSYHVYVAAALMEYYCTKDRKIAGNVFELGFKKFKDNEEYILAYVDHLSHLNGERCIMRKQIRLQYLLIVVNLLYLFSEDNNTRVLFERALTSGSLQPNQQM